MGRGGEGITKEEGDFFLSVYVFLYGFNVLLHIQITFLLTESE